MFLTLSWDYLQQIHVGFMICWVILYGDIYMRGLWSNHPTQLVFLEIEEDDKKQLVEPLINFKVTSSTRITDSLDLHMNSNLVPIDVWERFL